MKQLFLSKLKNRRLRSESDARGETEIGVTRRASLVFSGRDRLPNERKGDLAVHRLYHHYYEDLLM